MRQPYDTDLFQLFQCVKRGDPVPEMVKARLEYRGHNVNAIIERLETEMETV